MATEVELNIAQVRSNWQPDCLVDLGHGCQCGITTDDHCFVVLVESNGWTPTELVQSESIL